MFLCFAWVYEWMGMTLSEMIGMCVTLQQHGAAEEAAFTCADLGMRMTGQHSGRGSEWMAPL